MEQNKKKKSRDAARQRRGQQNDEFTELASQLPLNISGADKLDRLCVMRLSNSYIKIKHILQQIRDTNGRLDKTLQDNVMNTHIENALGGFVFVLAEDGQVLFISPNVSENLGLQQLDITGNSIYKYVHPCDQENLANQLGGQVPLEDMEIFDGLFSSDTSHYVKNPKQAVSSEFENSQHRSFSLRMKSTLTSRGKSVNINASIYRVVHCVGTIQTYRTKLGTSNGAMTRCFLGIGTPLLSTSSFEVPVDRQTFITKHSLDLKLTEIENLATDIMGYKNRSMLDTSWYVYTHICDNKVIKDYHNAVLKKGQALSGYYRVLLKDGGWVWMQTKANMVYQATSGQPQYIVCVHYVISDTELENVILSSEQHPIKTKQKNKRNSPINNKPIEILPKKFTKVIPSTPPIVAEPVVYSAKTEVVQSIPYQNPAGMVALNQVDLQPRFNLENDDPDMPGLEFLDVEEELRDIDATAFNERSPFIPGPFSDFDLKNRSISDLLADIDENELINRAPYIPPPCIDKIISFDDLSLPDQQDEFIGTATPFMDSNDLDSNQLYDFGGARVPAHLFKRLMPAINGKIEGV